MIKRVKLETIYKMAKEDNEKIKDRNLFPDGWDEKVYDYNSWEWCFTNNIDPIKYRGDDGDEPVPEWLIKKYEEQIKSE